MSHWDHPYVGTKVTWKQEGEFIASGKVILVMPAELIDENTGEKVSAIRFLLQLPGNQTVWTGPYVDYKHKTKGDARCGCRQRP